MADGRKWPWRAWLRTLHRDAGYLAVGLTFIYALSGIAINHIDDWNPNFVQFEQTVMIEAPIPDDRDAALALIKDELGIDGEPTSYVRIADQIQLEFADRAVRVDATSGQADIEGQEARFFFRVANWLHYNRGKAAWTYIADGYAAFLLFLAISGAFMLKGRKGLIGRGGVLIALGALVPILYVHFSGP